jgi:hypothetical protein
MKTLWCKTHKNPSDRISHAWAPLNITMVRDSMKPKQGFSPGQTRKIATRSVNTSQYPTLEKQFVLFFQRPFIHFLMGSTVRVYHSIRNNTFYFIIFWSFLHVRVTPFWPMPTGTE